MNWFKGLALAVGLGVSLLAAMPALAESATPVASSSAAKVHMAAAATDEDKDDTKMSETDKRAKAVECSQQADAKKLHGAARKKFRSTCKRGK